MTGSQIPKQSCPVAYVAYVALYIIFWWPHNSSKKQVFFFNSEEVFSKSIPGPNV